MKNVSHDPSSGAAPGGAPLNFLQSLLGAIRPPEWVVDEVQNRVVLFLNHVLLQEPVAQERLRRQKGKPVRVQWGAFHLTLAPTAAGLLERTAPEASPELSVTVTQTHPKELAQRVLSGNKPAVDIRGDVQLAAEVAWLVDNVRWDLEEDLSRLVGDAAAHTLARGARSAADGLKAFLARLPAGFPPRPPLRTTGNTGAADPTGPASSGNAA
jgi:ubiquinone biosynthesis protein UbiJ